jgi:hypothetical protein
MRKLKLIEHISLDGVIQTSALQDGYKTWLHSVKDFLYDFIQEALQKTLTIQPAKGYSEIRFLSWPRYFRKELDVHRG